MNINQEFHLKQTYHEITFFAYDIEKNKIGIFVMLMADEICHEYRDRNGRGGDRRRSR